MSSLKLTSIDYGRLVQYYAQKLHWLSLNKTQVQKILFRAYGLYLAQTGQKLFDDDVPRAWPYGPVFPKLYRSQEPCGVISFPPDTVDAFNNNHEACKIVGTVVDEMCYCSARELTEWSHKPGSPWYRTIHPDSGEQVSWNTEIPSEYIRDYFS